MKDIEKLREQYKVYCIMNNLIENERGFKYYLQDQAMLERGREARRKRRTGKEIEEIENL